jgi:tRNA (adenine37-N6)-methyltransferase
VSEGTFSIRSIGTVVRGRERGDDSDAWEVGESEIVIDAPWVDALDGIEEFSHLWIIWCFDTSDGTPLPLRVHPQRRQDLPLVGLFATRSPRRPNPIAVTAVRLLARERARLRVRGLDAFEASAVFDIKPYLRRGDLIVDSYQPEWLDRLWQEGHMPESTACQGEQNAGQSNH